MRVKKGLLTSTEAGTDIIIPMLPYTSEECILPLISKDIVTKAIKDAVTVEKSGASVSRFTITTESGGVVYYRPNGEYTYIYRKTASEDPNIRITPIDDVTEYQAFALTIELPFQLEEEKIASIVTTVIMTTDVGSVTLSHLGYRPYHQNGRYYIDIFGRAYIDGLTSDEVTTAAKFTVKVEYC